MSTAQAQANEQIAIPPLQLPPMDVSAVDLLLEGLEQLPMVRIKHVYSAIMGLRQQHLQQVLAKHEAAKAADPAGRAPAAVKPVAAAAKTAAKSVPAKKKR